MSDILDDRRRALEEQFFKEQNDALVKKMKEAAQHKATAESVQAQTGIRNPQVLEALAAMNIGPTAATVLSMLPLVEVAWADGKVDDKERKVVLEQAANLGVKADSEAGLYLTHWLDAKPSVQTRELWHAYVTELVKVMQPNAKELLKNEVLGRARLVAEASGGFLGYGFTVSSAEKSVLDALALAFA